MIMISKICLMCGRYFPQSVVKWRGNVVGTDLPKQVEMTAFVAYQILRNYKIICLFLILHAL